MSAFLDRLITYKASELTTLWLGWIVVARCTVLILDVYISR